MESRQDIALGLLFTGLGLVTAVLARSYSGASGVYPLVLGVAMALLGVAIAARAFATSSKNERVLVPEPTKLILTVVACLLYVALIVPLGFYTASVLLMLLLPLTLGFRQPLYLGLMALGFMVLVYIVFSVVLEKPLPAEIWSGTRLGAH